ncbi:MAG: peptidoglycan DD-metalloendopeptidase family protein [Actinomycetota bacterium]|nr:peptidoglycan DD-metalloendopeptidase family protein [Actinomycetota bacterium]
MARRCAVVLLLVVLFAAPTASGDVSTRKASVDSRIASLHAKIDAAQRQEDALRSEIASVTERIRSLDARVGGVSARLAVLENVLALHQARLDKLTRLFRLETKRYFFLKRQYALALERLYKRLIAIYENGDPSSIELFLASKSFSDILEQIDFARQIHRQDVSVSKAFRSAKKEARAARERTKRARAVVAAETRIVAARTQEVRSVRDELLASQNQLATARSGKRVRLAQVAASEREAVSEAQALEAVSGQLGAQITAAQSANAVTSAVPPHSSSGLIWPVNGPVVSGFGMRWGRMHNGIDIAVGSGAPIHAAASGTVVYSGWMGGYGNLVAIDHGGGLSTAYAHQSSIAAGNGQRVSQGQVIGYVGCTGHCFGPHLHFEVRVSGSPVDPLGYL